MMKLPRLWAPNKTVRKKMALEHLGFAAVSADVRVAQYKYLTASRDPSELKPLGITDSTADWILGRYKAAPKKLSLEWITQARNNHQLTACPMCGGTAVSTLEHILPKTDYPEFAVLSFNLVPSCDGCQRRRSAKGSQFHFLHPYFDHDLLDAVRIMVTFTRPFEVVEYSRNIAGVDGENLERLRKHLDHSINPILFKRQMRSLWSKWHYRSFEKEISFIQQDIQEWRQTEERFSPNSWDAMFLRGLECDNSAVMWMSATPPQ